MGVLAVSSSILNALCPRGGVDAFAKEIVDGVEMVQISEPDRAVSTRKHMRCREGAGCTLVRVAHEEEVSKG